MALPKSCDTFVVLPGWTKGGAMVFGKNSDRPQDEVQEVVLVKGGVRESPKLKCTYITIDEAETPVNDVILSKPSWMWGAEMGANTKNVVIGNEAVWTNNNEGDGDARQKRLLGMDLVRLGLERGNSAVDALEVITSLLEKYGQGGPCSEQDDSHFYHNSFLIADAKEAWVLETSGKLWAAEKIRNGYRNISNGLSITTTIDKHTEDLKEKARSIGVWNGVGEFNFMQCFSSGGDDYRQQEGERLLREWSAANQFGVKDMMRVLRHRESHICRGCNDTFPTQGSQVSYLNDMVSVHWFTATPDPSISFYKPFIFTPNAKLSPHTQSPDNPEDREHHLYKLHTKFVVNRENNNIIQSIRELEQKTVTEVSEIMRTGAQNKDDKLDSLMNDCVEAELKLYV